MRLFRRIFAAVLINNVITDCEQGHSITVINPNQANDSPTKYNLKWCHLTRQRFMWLRIHAHCNYWQSSCPCSSAHLPKINSELRLNDAVSLFHEALSLWAARSTVYDAYTEALKQDQTEPFKIFAIIHLGNLRRSKTHDKISHCIGDL